MDSSIASLWHILEQLNVFLKISFIRLLSFSILILSVQVMFLKFCAISWLGHSHIFKILLANLIWPCFFQSPSLVVLTLNSSLSMLCRHDFHPCQNDVPFQLLSQSSYLIFTLIAWVCFSSTSLYGINIFISAYTGNSCSSLSANNLSTLSIILSNCFTMTRNLFGWIH